jgi:uncharacterized phage protein (TIGR02218 family)
MTTFLDIEHSVSDGTPVEAYTFSKILDSASTPIYYRYTTHSSPITVSGNVYTPVVMNRSEIKVSNQDTYEIELTLEMPNDTLVIQEIAFDRGYTNLHLEVLRAHRVLGITGEFASIWKGPISNFEIVGNIATVHSPNVFSRTMASQYPHINYQAQCNNVLFDSLCKVSKPVFTYTSTVNSINKRFISVTDDHAVDGYLKGGEFSIDRTKERRMIAGNSSNVIEVNFQFTDIRIGDNVTFTAGCGHSYAECKAKFSNGRNYGGFPFIPADNPFTGTVG